MIRTTKNLFRALARVFPDCGSNAQAIAFNLFVAFFPVILLALGLVAASKELSAAVMEVLRDLRFVVPPGSRQLLSDFLVSQSQKTRELLTLGALGTVLVGTQAMCGFLLGIRRIYRDTREYSFLADQLRGFLLLVVSFVPLLAVSLLTVFGRPVRAWMIQHFGLPQVFNMLWVVVYISLALVLATLVLVLLYHVGHPRGGGWNTFLPGAFVATLLWWVVNTAFGYYVRRVPYSIVYGGLAAAIGLAIWMNLSALVVLYGAAFNAVRESDRS
jgi:membrane protein